MRAAEDVPAWVRALVTKDVAGRSDNEVLALAVGIAEGSVRAGGGPFGAMIMDCDGRVASVGWNQVVALHDSTAHAEIVAIRRAQATLGTHDLAAAEGAPFSLFTSAAPCIQCFGAIYWSGLSRVVSAADTSRAEAAGFREGPVSRALWDTARDEKGIHHALGTLPEAVVRRPFDVYRAAGGPIY